MMNRSSDSIEKTYKGNKEVVLICSNLHIYDEVGEE